VTAESTRPLSSLLCLLRRGAHCPIPSAVAHAAPSPTAVARTLLSLLRHGAHCPAPPPVAHTAFCPLRHGTGTVLSAAGRAALSAPHPARYAGARVAPPAWRSGKEREGGPGSAAPGPACARPGPSARDRKMPGVRPPLWRAHGVTCPPRRGSHQGYGACRTWGRRGESQGAPRPRGSRLQPCPSIPG